jgi:hypothetical protein
VISIAPHLPWPAWSALVVASVGLLAWYTRTSRGNLPATRWRVVICLMAAALALPLVLLLNPIRVEPIPPPPGKPLVTILLDASAGMTTDDVAGTVSSGAVAAKPNAAVGATRFAAAKRAALDASKGLQGDYDVEIRLFADRVRPAAADRLEAAAADNSMADRDMANGETTDLAAAIEESLVADRPRGQTLVLLSDGIHNADVGSARVLEAARRAKAAAAPVFVRTFGGAALVRDVALRFTSSQELAFVGRPIPVNVQVAARGLAGREVEVELRRDDKTLERRRVTLSDGVEEVRFHVADDEVGLVRYEAAIQPIDGEVSSANNAAPLVVRTVDQPIRILLLEGKPYWDTKFFTRTLASDAAVELTTVVQMTRGRLLERTLTLERGEKEGRSDGGTEGRRIEDVEGADSKKPPTAAAVTPPAAGDGEAALVAHKEQWRVVANPTEWLGDDARLNAFQVVVLGRDADVFLAGDAADRLRRWIDRQGGSLVCFRGAPTVETGRELATVLPLRWTPARETRFHLQVTDYGRDWRWFPAVEDDADAFAGMPKLAAAAIPDRLKPAARVLATTGSDAGGGTAGSSETRAGADESRAVVTYQPFGLGQIVVVEGAGMWRWAFLPPEHQSRDEVYSGLWRALVRRLVSGAGLLPGQNIALRSEQVLFGDRDSAAVTLLVRDPAAMRQIPEVELSGSSLEGARRVKPAPVNDDPSLFRASFGPLPEGRYQAKLVGEGFDAARDAVSTAFDVRRNLTERLDLTARPDLMRRIAAESDGAELKGESADELKRQLAEHYERTRPREVRRIEAWDRWWVMLMVVGLWTASWSLRRRSGRV